jgi:hypothetical protein
VRLVRLVGLVRHVRLVRLVRLVRHVRLFRLTRLVHLERLGLYLLVHSTHISLTGEGEGGK